ncbi:hypothetical protein [Anaerosoma tenue]|uniref:hypothetical protein n=1 Tax=Anaerosoma tenue TaxID=2933588 RepID=UPI002260FE99|nr:hypothetical protein [Anaerosoma tenue]MCK8115916.1 hypothetical protein [Anaerosoma tenue]
MIQSASREVTPAFTLHQMSYSALLHAKSGGRGHYLDTVTAMLLCPLTVEAVLNHVGAYLFLEKSYEPEVWAAVEWLRPEKKLDAIAERSRLAIDKGVAPFQDFKAMFGFRRQLAHGRSVSLSTTEIPAHAVDDEGYLLEMRVPGLLAEWESLVDIKTAERWRASVRGISDELSSAAGCIDPTVVGNGVTYLGGLAAASDEV